MSDAGSHPDLSALTTFRQTLSVVRGIVANLTHVDENALLDGLVLKAQASRLGDLDASTLFDIATDGHVVQLTASSGGWELRIRAEGPAEPAVETSGPIEEALAGDAIGLMEGALRRGDIRATVALAAEVPCLMRVELRNEAATSGAHWVPTVSSLVSLLSGEKWLATVTNLSSGPTAALIEDIGEARLTTSGFSFFGPDTTPSHVHAGKEDEPYRKARVSDGWMDLPSPILFQPVPDQQTAPAQTVRVEQLRQALIGATRSLAWYWLASKAKPDPSGALTVTFSGAREISIRLMPVPGEDATQEVALYSWASSSADPAKEEAVQHAISLALLDPTDLDSAAGPSLRTARLLYDLARKGAVAEALAARRSARTAAAESAHGAAVAARDAAGKSVERALIQVAATAAVVLSESGHLIGRSSAFGLLALILAISLGSLLVAVVVEFPSADAGLTSELDDLRQYRDLLSSDEIGDIQTASAIGYAKRDLRRARRTVITIYVAVMLVVVTASLLVWNRGIPSSTAGRTPSRAPTSTS